MKIPPELDGLSKREIIRRYLLLEARLAELERRLLAYENAHTPPSQQKGERHYPLKEAGERKRGAPEGHKGSTRETPIPTETKTLLLTQCPCCGQLLGMPKRTERRVIEEIPQPGPLRVIEFLIPHYECLLCNKEIISQDPELPNEGRLGINLQSQIVLMKYEERLPYRRIADVLNRQYGLALSPATILDVLRRAADKLAPSYKEIKEEIQKSPRANADETGAKVEGKKHWFWVFMSSMSVLFLLRKKRDHKVIEEALGKEYGGILTVDGLRAYQVMVKSIQRCWAHLLREAKFIAQKYEGQARILYSSLCEIFAKIKRVTQETSINTRKEIYEWCVKQIHSFLNIAKAYKELRKLATTIENGIEQWFTCILYPDVEPTNNRAERELREFVVQRKIFPTFRSQKGTQITETLMSVLATWRLRGLNTQSMLRQTLSS